ncbi:MAG: alpha/beta fold hydrolase [Candidatus Omnitrophica bacterium]|nr:alpha/beta fold hydrolase [Candidatus Omnitrophota bacterium]
MKPQCKLLKNMKTGSVYTEDKKKIYFDQYKNGHKKLVIIAHGFFNSKEALLLKDLGQEMGNDYDVLIMDFRGHGQSKGLFYWTTKEHIDLKAVLKNVRSQYEKIGVIGFSLGAATSIVVAAKTDLMDSLICVSAPGSFEGIEFHFWELDIETDILYNLVGDGRTGKGVRAGPFWLKKDKPINLVEKIKVPVFYLHGEKDWVIKPQHSKKLFDKTTAFKKLSIIKDGFHAEYLMQPKNKDEVLGLIRKWFKETL